MYINRFWQVYASGYEQFEVKNGYDGYDVNLNNKTCGCRAWQLTGIPCVHGVAAISYLNRNHEEYVARWYTTAKFSSCYMYTIKPLNGSELWPQVDYTKPLPPKKRRLPGRPKMKRRLDESERQDRGHSHSVSRRGTVLKCRICKLPGHNRATCPQRPTDGPNAGATSGATAGPSGVHKKQRKPKKHKKQGMYFFAFQSYCT